MADILVPAANQACLDACGACAYSCCIPSGDAASAGCAPLCPDCVALGRCRVTSFGYRGQPAPGPAHMPVRTVPVGTWARR